MFTHNIESNPKFMTAVMHWISAFPSSTIDANEPLDHLRHPQMITTILRLLMDEHFTVDVDFEQYKGLQEGLLVDVSDEEEYLAMFDAVRQYSKDKLWSKKKLFKYLDMLKLDELARGEYFALTVLCFVFTEIGLHSFKSGIAISTISMLDDADREELKQFLYDDQDLSGRNLVLMQRVNLIESENAELKKRLGVSEGELLRLKKTPAFLVEEELEKVIKEKNDEIDKLTLEQVGLRQQNKELKRDLAQLNEDCFAIGSIEKSPRKLSPTKRNNISISSTNSTEALKEVELLKWELNMMSDWILSVCAERERLSARRQ
ncbi:CYFA0S09e01398g1_1 [Cyberlindnera fabianii]|uniref:CYFA0S09e01398g1_1 n=1 Tax=Cyberlindnera fabianii TaxID=36022 RepID=A0A061B5N3_CYBFA|nr:CYFA0S09e01398g1_1 [Cyberlindnera fabianii]